MDQPGTNRPASGPPGGEARAAAIGRLAAELARLVSAGDVVGAQVLRRIYGFDVLRCRGCGGRLRLRSAITDRAVARAILTQLGLPSDAPRARGRDPTIVHDDPEDIWSDGA